MLDQLENQFLPLVVARRVGDVLVNFREKHFRFETQAKNRFGLRGEDRLDHFVERVPMIAPAFGVKIEKFLHENAEGLRMQLGDLLDVRVEHGLVRKPALAQRVTCQVNWSRRWRRLQDEFRIG